MMTGELWTWQQNEEEMAIDQDSGATMEIQRERASMRR
jgi:hypothetical protein